ncbi:unnamed protein product [Urochloa humidicola]
MVATPLSSELAVAIIIPCQLRPPVTALELARPPGPGGRRLLRRTHKTAPPPHGFGLAALQRTCCLHLDWSRQECLASVSMDYFRLDLNILLGMQDNKSCCWQRIPCLDLIEIFSEDYRD